MLRVTMVTDAAPVKAARPPTIALSCADARHGIQHMSGRHGQRHAADHHADLMLGPHAPAGNETQNEQRERRLRDRHEAADDRHQQGQKPGNLVQVH